MRDDGDITIEGRVGDEGVEVCCDFESVLFEADEVLLQKGENEKRDCVDLGLVVESALGILLFAEPFAIERSGDLDID